MNSAEKHRILAAYDRAGLVAALASRGFYVFGEIWRDRACGRLAHPAEAVESLPTFDDEQPRPAPRDRDPGSGEADVST